MTKHPTIPAAYLALHGDWPDVIARRSKMLAEFQPALNAAFDVANGRAAANTLKALDAIDAARNAEKALETMGVPKALRAGTEVWHLGAGPSSKSYKYEVATTEFTLRRDRKGNWALIDVSRVKAFPGTSAGYRMMVSDAARDAIVKHALRDIAVHAK
jgi:hypothetical protein